MKQFENNKDHTFNCIDYVGRMAEWSKVLVSGTSHFDGLGSNSTPVMLHCYKLKVFICRNNSKIINNIPSTGIDCICRMAEWSNVLISGTSHFDGVCFNLTPVMIHCYKWTILSAKKQFENNKQHTLNFIDYIGMSPSGLRCCFQVLVMSYSWVRIPLLSCYTVTNEQFY